MRPGIRQIRSLLGAMVVAATFMAAPPAFAQPQESLTDQLKARFSKTGVFFRADAPRSLRNPGDVYLPIFVEIINGVEQEAHTTGSGVSNYVSRNPLKFQGVNVFVKPSGVRHQFAKEPLLLGDEQRLFIRPAGGRPTPGDSRPIQENAGGPPGGNSELFSPATSWEGSSLPWTSGFQSGSQIGLTRTFIFA